MPMYQVFRPIRKYNFVFPDLIKAHLSLAGFSNTLSLSKSFGGFGLNVFAQLAGPVIMMFLFLVLP